ncbi:MAG: glutamate--tRNA ligase [Wolbachia endosymbiont of Tyrophagus putrescentiae]|nr:glutamate--tRNA ligase [Wolbachia endosymbiont of Tyrophagus putrescentiae]
MSKVVTRFAPSPTGSLHIGGARTALFNWLYAKRHGGKFLLRIEDTDRKRSTKEAVDVIINGLKWLGIDHKGEIIYQSKRIERHLEIANLLVEKGKAYYCYCCESKVAEEKTHARAVGKVYKHKCTTNIDKSIKPVVRFKVADPQEITIDDKVYGQIKVNSDQIDDIVILRSDNTPTYIFAVVVDDHDAGVTHIIRGSDHLTNTFKQILIYQALDFDIPHFAHVPLIHDENGNKLSKRHGAVSICDYEKMGILPQAMRNYLLRLGWSHNNDEVISNEEAINWFNLENIGRSPARLDFKKLEYLNNHYINNTSNEEILNTVFSISELTEKKKNYLLQGLTEIKKRANYLTELRDLARFYTDDLPLHLTEKAHQVIKYNSSTIGLLASFLSDVNWSKDSLSTKIKEFANLHSIKTIDVYHSLRAPITGIMDAPGIVDIMVTLGKDECIKRLQYYTT